MADPDSPSNQMSSVDDVQQTSSNQPEQHQESTTNDWPW
jgi:hypothetical protein